MRCERVQMRPPDRGRHRPEDAAAQFPEEPRTIRVHLANPSRRAAELVRLPDFDCGARGHEHEGQRERGIGCEDDACGPPELVVSARNSGKVNRQASSAKGKPLAGHGARAGLRREEPGGRFWNGRSSMGMPLRAALMMRPNGTAKEAPIPALIIMCTTNPANAEGRPTILPIIGNIPIIAIIIPKATPPARPPITPLQIPLAFMNPYLYRLGSTLGSTSRIANRIRQ